MQARGCSVSSMNLNMKMPQPAGYDPLAESIIADRYPRRPDEQTEQELRTTIRLQVLEALNVLTENADDYPKGDIKHYAALMSSLAQVLEAVR